MNRLQLAFALGITILLTVALIAAMWPSGLPDPGRADLPALDADLTADAPTTRPDRAAGFLGRVRRYDRNGDGRIARAEWAGPARLFTRIDTDRDGVLDRDELTRAADRMDRRDRPRPTDAPTTQPADAPPTTQPDRPAAQPPRPGQLGPDRGPAVGQPAPDFTLPTLDGKAEVTLSKIYADKPTLLVLGSYTCPPFRSVVPTVDDLVPKYKDRVNFLFVYIREAHTNDGWQTPANRRDKLTFTQPTTFDERTEIATTCRRRLSLDMTMLVDGMDNAVMALYSGWPNRAYLIDAAGKVTYRGPHGPRGTQVRPIEQAIRALLQAD